MRFGDHCAALPSDGSDGTDDNIQGFEEFMMEQHAFMKQLVGDYDHKTFLQKYGFISQDKVVMYLIGTSGAGKSYFSRQNCDKFSEGQVAIIGRDECIVEAITGKYERLTGDEYALVYAVYNAKKALYIFCKKFEGKRQTRNMDQQKAKLEQSVAEAEAAVDTVDTSSKAEASDSTESNVSTEDIVQKVNTLFCDKIKAALENPTVKLVIIDTMMSLFPSGIQSCVSPISDLLNGHFIIHVHVQNYKERLSGENVGGDLAKQLEVAGPFGPTQPLHP
ncbi:unnamed protein product, partial [marine sediment metagenome]